MKEFPALLQTFLIDYLPTRRGFSPHTIAAYRDTFVLFLKWARTQQGVAPEKVTMDHLTPTWVKDFTCWLTEQRGCSPSTVNARIAAIKSFARFTQTEAPEHIETCRQLLETPAMKAPKHLEVEYLTVTAVQHVITAAQPCVRDLAIITLLYDSGARVSEICTVTVGDLTLQRPHTVKVLGKGRKTRVVPLSKEAGQILSQYLTQKRPTAPPARPLFTNRSGQPLGRAGIAYVLQKAVTAAHAAHPTQVPPKVSPHMMRHSKAMHLLEAGVDLIYIRDFLGHQSVTTTETYARASTEMKRRAIEQVQANVVPESLYNPQQRADLINWLQELL